MSAGQSLCLCCTRPGHAKLLDSQAASFTCLKWSVYFAIITAFGVRLPLSSGWHGLCAEMAASSDTQYHGEDHIASGPEEGGATAIAQAEVVSEEAAAPALGVMPNPYDRFHYRDWTDEVWSSVSAVSEEAYWYHFMLYKTTVWTDDDWNQFAESDPDTYAYLLSMNESQWTPGNVPGGDMYAGPTVPPPAETVAVDSNASAQAEDGQAEHTAVVPSTTGANEMSPEAEALAEQPTLNSSHLQSADASDVGPHSKLGVLNTGPPTDGVHSQQDSTGIQVGWPDPDDIDEGEQSKEAEEWSRWLHERKQQVPIDTPAVDTSSDVRLCPLATSVLWGATDLHTPLASPSQRRMLITREPLVCVRG